MKTRTDDDRLIAAAARINTFALGFVFAILCGAGLFLMTIFLLLKGGDSVGTHLQLLGQFFPGYSVSWVGSLAGLLYGAVCGALAGGAIGYLYNSIVRRFGT